MQDANCVLCLRALAQERSAAELALGLTFLTLAEVRLFLCKSNGEEMLFIPLQLAVLLFATYCDFILIILGH